MIYLFIYFISDFINKFLLLGIGDWGWGIGDWGLGPIPNPQSPIPNPQSPIPKNNKNLLIKSDIKYINK